MCCHTHGVREYPGEIAAGENWRCRCAAGMLLLSPAPGGETLGEGRCERKATQEDLLCDICSGRTYVGADPARTYRPDELQVDSGSRIWANPPSAAPDQWEWKSPGVLSGEVPMPAREEMAKEIYQQVDWTKIGDQLRDSISKYWTDPPEIPGA